MLLQAQGLKGQAKHTHPFVRLRVGQQQQLTSIKWSTLGPSWEGEPITFKCAVLLLETISHVLSQLTSIKWGTLRSQALLVGACSDLTLSVHLTTVPASSTRALP